LVLEEKRLRNEGTDATRTEQPGKSRNEVDEKKLPDGASENGSRRGNPEESWAK
jgi:hypothetical protein